VAFDDRALNKDMFIEDHTRHGARIVTSLDIVEDLIARRLISDAERRTFHRLRTAGASLILADADEVKFAAARNAQQQSAEFRAQRDSRDLSRITEIPYFPGENAMVRDDQFGAEDSSRRNLEEDRDPQRAAVVAEAICELWPKPEDWVACWKGQPPPKWIGKPDDMSTQRSELIHS
jgi:hypothetical protein